MTTTALAEVTAAAAAATATAAAVVLVPLSGDAPYQQQQQLLNRVNRSLGDEFIGQQDELDELSRSPFFRPR